MARMVVVYKTPENAEAFTQHYFAVHAPLVRALPGLRRFDVSDGPVTSRADSDAAFMIATLHFDDLQSLQDALASEAGKRCGADRLSFAPDASRFQIFLFETKDLTLS